MAKFNDWLMDSFIGFFVALALGLVLLCGIFVLPLSHLNYHSNIQTYYALQETVENARDMDDIERAALTHILADANTWLRRAQYWNTKPVVNWYIPDKVMELEPLR